MPIRNGRPHFLFKQGRSKVRGHVGRVLTVFGLMERGWQDFVSGPRWVCRKRSLSCAMLRRGWIALLLHLRRGLDFSCKQELKAQVHEFLFLLFSFDNGKFAIALNLCFISIFNWRINIIGKQEPLRICGVRGCDR